MSNSIPKYEFQLKNIFELDRTSETNIETIRLWLNENKQIPQQSDHQIVLFLLSCQNDIKLTTKTILNYYKDKHNAPEFFTNRDPTSENFKKHFQVVHLTLFPKYTAQNYMILYGGLRDTNYRNFFLDELTKIFFMCVEIGLNKNPPSGLVVILDMKGVGFMHLTRLKIGTIQKLLKFLQESLPCQLKAIHVINANYLFDKIFFICKPFMKKELIQMIHPHLVDTPFSDFHKFVPPECLPIDFEGELESLEVLTRDTLKNLKKLKSFYEDDERQLSHYKIK